MHDNFAGDFQSKDSVREDSMCVVHVWNAVFLF